MSTNIKFITRFEYIFYVKIRWIVSLWIWYVLIKTVLYKVSGTIFVMAEGNLKTWEYDCSMYVSYPRLRACIMA